MRLSLAGLWHKQDGNDCQRNTRFKRLAFRVCGDTAGEKKTFEKPEADIEGVKSALRDQAIFIHQPQTHLYCWIMWFFYLWEALCWLGLHLFIFFNPFSTCKASVYSLKPEAISLGITWHCLFFRGDVKFSCATLMFICVALRLLRASSGKWEGFCVWVPELKQAKCLRLSALWKQLFITHEKGMPRKREGVKRVLNAVT